MKSTRLLGIAACSGLIFLLGFWPALAQNSSADKSSKSSDTSSRKTHATGARKSAKNMKSADTTRTNFNQARKRFEKSNDGLEQKKARGLPGSTGAAKSDSKPILVEKQRNSRKILLEHQGASRQPDHHRRLRLDSTTAEKQTRKDDKPGSEGGGKSETDSPKPPPL